ncbi:MAG: GntR family transcriptional regulator [Desulfobacteraceae bacterium]|nr:GntR family transcriptional regulator [Desulfobacteraceae bacterium]
MLNPKSPIPLYHQLADILLERIRSGVYSPGQIIPSETGLAKLYSIGRPTVRQAMDTLVKKGLIQRKRGAGTFVKHLSPQVDLFSLAGTSQAFLTKGIPIETRIIEPIAQKKVTRDPENPFNNQNAFFLSRLTLSKKIPVLLEEIYMNSELFRGIDKIDLENRSLARIVADHYHLTPENANQQFKIQNLDSQKASWLQLAPMDPILTVRRKLNFSHAPNAVFSILYCRTDEFTFSQTIQSGGL